MSNSVCIYAYYEKNRQYRKNLEYFLAHGLNDASDFVIVVNGACSASLPQRANLTVLRRENEGYDFGAWAHALDSLKRHYDYYIFINSSVRGPHRLRGRPASTWQQELLSLLRGDVKLAGTTINIYRLT